MKYNYFSMPIYNLFLIHDSTLVTLSTSIINKIFM